MESILQSSPIIWAIFVSLSVYPIYKSLFSTKNKYWRAQSQAGRNGHIFSGMRAALHAVKNTRALVMAGYDKFSKHGKVFLIPQFGSDPVIVLPPSEMHDLLQKPDEQLDAHIMHAQQIAQTYTVGDDLFDSGIQVNIVRRHLTRKLYLLTSDVHEEIVHATRCHFGTDTETWNTIAAYPTCMKIVSQAANRVFSGPELCRDSDFLEHSRLYAISVFTGAALINLIPAWIRPFLAPLVALTNAKNLRVCMNRALPVIKRKIQEMHDMKARGESWTPPNDALSWLIEAASQHPDPSELDAKKLCRRLLILNMVAIHTTSMAITNTIFDLYSSPHLDEDVLGLREECDRVLAAHDAKWTKVAVNELVRVDSAIKESLRFSNLGHLGLRRLVINSTGLQFGDNIHVPSGVCVVTPNYAIHRDPTNYESPNEWDAFRFSRPCEAFTVEAKSSDTSENMKSLLEQKNSNLVTSSSSFLSFGHGKHACPGRFFASQEMKLMLAHLVTTYDIRIPGQRPRNIDIKGNSVPDSSAKIQVRLRTSN